MIDILKGIAFLVWLFGAASLMLLGAIAAINSPWLGGVVAAIGIVLFLLFLAFAVD